MGRKKPYGRIDYLGTDGEVGEQFYLFSEDEFLRRVRDDNHCGVPMIVNVFCEVSRGLPEIEFDPPPQGYRMIEYEEGEELNEYDKLRLMAQRYRAMYPPGTRVELIHMDDDPRPIEVGVRGTIDCIDDIGILHCTFDNGRKLGIVPGEDSFRMLTRDEIAEEMSRKLQDAYIDKINREVIPDIDWHGMCNAYLNHDTQGQTALLKRLHETFAEVYGTTVLGEDYGMVSVPGIARVADGTLYVALFNLDLASSGELWGTTFITPQGILDDASGDPDVRQAVRSFIPYMYWYTPIIAHDIHVDRRACPEDIREMLFAAATSEVCEVQLGVNLETREEQNHGNPVL